MRRIYKNISSPLLGCLIIAAGMTSPVQAATAQCTALGAKRQRVTETIQPKIDTLNDLRVKNKFDVPQMGSVTQTKIDADRKSADAKREAIYVKIEAKTKTPKQKAAVATYKEDVQDALTIRREAEDTARANFLLSVSALFDTHRAAVDAGLTVLSGQYDSAYASAAAQCEKIGTVKATAALKSSIAQVEKNFTTLPNISPDAMAAAIKSLADTKQTADNTAAKVFQASLATAHAALEKSLGKDTKNILEPSD